MSKRFEICLAGSGGQGVITAAVMAGEAASIFCDNLYAVQTQSYGPAARGGSAKAEVVISDEPIDYPKPVAPDLMICLTGDAAAKYARDVKAGGRLVLDSFSVQPGSRAVQGRAKGIDVRVAGEQRSGGQFRKKLCALSR